MTSRHHFKGLIQAKLGHWEIQGNDYNSLLRSQAAQNYFHILPNSKVSLSFSIWSRKRKSKLTLLSHSQGQFRSQPAQRMFLK